MNNKIILKSIVSFVLFTLIAEVVFAQEAVKKGTIKEGNVGGYMITKVEKVDTTYNAGYSMYVAAFPLIREYPGRQFQSGLFGTWMFPRNDKPLPVEKVYTDVEGGLG
jgi:hypothetical protein